METDFAKQYLWKHSIEPNISDAPHKNLNIAIVIPSFNEPDLLKTLVSIANCSPVSSAVEVIIVVNSPEGATKEVTAANIRTLSLLSNWILCHQSDTLKYFVLYEPKFPTKHAGAGFARKVGMDEAVSRFNKNNNPDGIIVSMDADTLCDPNYLAEIEKHYKLHPRANGASVYFEHPLDGDEFPGIIYNGITRYELYLRYYLHGLRYAGFPYAFYTIGSCFTVRASAYVKQGGMNKRKAGEDFYFLQKIIPLGDYHDILSTRVTPSPRPSRRVPFGTGAVISQFIDGKDILTYNLQSFIDLGIFFEQIENLYKIKQEGYEKIIQNLPLPLKKFLIMNDFYTDLEEINANCSTIETFCKRFYLKFDAFRILKFLNFSHDAYYAKTEVFSASLELSKLLGFMPQGCITEKELLLKFRHHEKGV